MCNNSYVDNGSNFNSNTSIINVCCVCFKPNIDSKITPEKNLGRYFCSSKCYRQHLVFNQKKKKRAKEEDVAFLKKQLLSRSNLNMKRDELLNKMGNIKAQMFIDEVYKSVALIDDVWCSLEAVQEKGFPNIYRCNINKTSKAESPDYVIRYSNFYNELDQLEYELFQIDKFLTSGKSISYSYE